MPTFRVLARVNVPILAHLDIEAETPEEARLFALAADDNVPAPDDWANRLWQWADWVGGRPLWQEAGNLQIETVCTMENVVEFRACIEARDPS